MHDTKKYTFFYVRFCLQFLQHIFAELSKANGDNYPESAGRIFVVNAPFMFEKAWKMIKIWIDPNTAAKFSIFTGSLGNLHEAVDKS